MFYLKKRLEGGGEGGAVAFLTHSFHLEHQLFLVNQYIRIWREGGEEGGAVDFLTDPFHLLLLRLSVYHYIVIMYKLSYGKAVLEGLFPFVKISCML